MKAFGDFLAFGDGPGRFQLTHDLSVKQTIFFCDPIGWSFAWFVHSGLTMARVDFRAVPIPISLRARSA